MQSLLILFSIAAPCAFSRRGTEDVKALSPEVRENSLGYYPREQISSDVTEARKHSEPPRPTGVDAQVMVERSLVTVGMSILPALVAQLVFLSPSLGVIYAVLNNNPKLLVPLFNFTSMLVCASAWAIYGLLDQDYAILVANTAGVVLSVIYIAVHIVLNWKYNDSKTIVNLVFVFTSITVMALASTLLPYTFALTVLGYWAVGLVVLMFSAPLLSLLTVKKMESISLAFATIGVINCVLWFWYGLAIRENPMVWVPNGMGAISCAIQAIIAFRERGTLKAKDKPAKVDPSEGDMDPDPAASPFPPNDDSNLTKPIIAPAVLVTAQTDELPVVS